jgi:hypothetical protein
MTQSNNPLRRFFRQPSIYLRLPSQGKYYPPGTLDMPPNGELPILPMTALDEILARTPDALFNGSATAEVIRSCVPNIQDPWAVPSVDLNALLVASRVASYGHEMPVPTTCPKCETEQEVELDLRVVLDSLRAADYDQPLQQGDMLIYFAPLTYRQMNENSRIKFDDEKLLQSLAEGGGTEEQKLAQLGETFRRVTEMTVNVVSESIAAIKTNDAMVTEKEYIREFLKNCPKIVFEAIKDHAVELRRGSDLKPLALTCSQCQHEYQQEFTLDMSNFFGAAS